MLNTSVIPHNINIHSNTMLILRVTQLCASHTHTTPAIISSTCFLYYDIYK